MDKPAASNFSRMVLLLIALVIVGMSVFSMSAMKHQDNPLRDCVQAMDTHSASLPQPQSSDSCVEFHLSLIEKFSHGFHYGFALKFFAAVLAFVSFFFLADGLLDGLMSKSEILRTRLRQLFFDIISIFRENFGHWLSLLEKRDPSYALKAA